MMESENILKIEKSSPFATVEVEIADANKKGYGLWELRQTESKGWGIFALISFEPDQIVFSSRATDISDRTPHTIQKDWSTHILINLPGRFINHSCLANTGIVDNSFKAFDFYAMKHINAGDEITWDYGAAEFNAVCFQECLCGSARCRGALINFEGSHQAIRRQYGEYYAEYLHDWSPRI